MQLTVTSENTDIESSEQNEMAIDQSIKNVSINHVSDAGSFSSKQPSSKRFQYVAKLVQGVLPQNFPTKEAQATSDSQKANSEKKGIFKIQTGNKLICIVLLPESDKTIANVLLKLVPKLATDPPMLTTPSKLISYLKMSAPLSSTMTNSMNYPDSTNIKEDDKQLLEISTEVTDTDDRSSEAPTAVVDVQNKLGKQTDI